ncbi:hypothetical protein BLNAU_18837 [Blattamonas nauphoetae]|uniref:Uncharacterized protein n=1 Tax=Blattamonas nauphoetae TaxID=2049346 RepID=A0ABQ9X390_9EUKA|nr:hypothetical protein BLNAU_24166 [Blattamonas nauphoetae]KAK2946235.1 hypothetical protein BLNAU_18837 [Blattamonas nauphoetae]
MRKQVNKFTTKPKPPIITLFVDDSSTFDDLTCGDLTNPCPSINKTWIIADGLGHNEITLKVLKETKETKSFVISKDLSVLIENGKNVNGIIRIPTTATHPVESALITVTEVGSIVTLKECVIDGVNISVPNSDSLTICEWTSGVIRLDNGATTIDWTKYLSPTVIEIKENFLRSDSTDEMKQQAAELCHTLRQLQSTSEGAQSIFISFPPFVEKNIMDGDVTRVSG